MKIRYIFYLVTIILATLAVGCEDLGLQIALATITMSLFGVTELLCRLAVRYE